MRTLQLLGFLLAIAGIILGYMMLAPIDGETSEASASVAGMGIMLIVLPAFGWSALMLVPSSLALFKAEVRQRTYFKGQFWLNLWKLNIVLSALYIFVALCIAYLWISVSINK
ncbi:carbon starvation protein CstA [Shewanella sp. AS16]|uniref:carbon starvation protein CstA n=1 Tax=Shewanella sp. AS16 TaxID=2907625 RepID=UPI001F2EDBE9|nr:carbon starvation protein CstA [Shewanella sp. AS16]MCE9684686.1 carbon starvation protein CstA [Shewanella sp. AS16]